MVFRTVFDIVQDGYRGSGMILAGLVFVLIGAIMLWRPGLVPERSPWGSGRKGRSPMAYGILCIGLLFSSWSLWTSYSQYRQTAALLREHRYKVAEGTVTGFQSGGSPGKYYEDFTVGTKTFSYYGSEMSGYGFHRLAADGGPIRNGLYVRISYSGGTILRLETAP